LLEKYFKTEEFKKYRYFMTNKFDLAAKMAYNKFKKGGLLKRCRGK